MATFVNGAQLLSHTPYRSDSFSLPEGELHRLESQHEATIVSVNSGLVWITSDGEPGDIIVLAGEFYELRPASTILLQALRSSVYTLATAHKSAPFGE